MDILTFIKHRTDLQSLMLSIGTVLAGTAAAVIRGNMEILPATTCLLFAIITQIGCNLYHYYTFMNRISGENVTRRISGTEIRANATAMRVLREGSIACLLISLMFGITILTMTVRFWWALAAGVLLYLCLWVMARFPGFYRSPASLIVTFLVFGPIGVMATALLQYQYEAANSLLTFFDSAPSLFLAPAMGLLACSHHIVMAYFNNRIDPNPNRPGLINSLGKKFSIFLVGLNGVLVVALFIVMVLFLGFPKPLIAVVPGFLAFFLNSYIAIRLNSSGVCELRHLNTLTRVNFLLTALLCFILWWIIGSPDDSLRVLF